GIGTINAARIMNLSASPTGTNVAATERANTEMTKVFTGYRFIVDLTFISFSFVSIVALSRCDRRHGFTNLGLDRKGKPHTPIDQEQDNGDQAGTGEYIPKRVSRWNAGGSDTASIHATVHHCGDQHIAPAPDKPPGQREREGKNHEAFRNGCNFRCKQKEQHDVQ